jgi:hypothetical protein
MTLLRRDSVVAVLLAAACFAVNLTTLRVGLPNAERAAVLMTDRGQYEELVPRLALLQLTSRRVTDKWGGITFVTDAPLAADEKPLRQYRAYFLQTVWPDEGQPLHALQSLRSRHSPKYYSYGGFFLLPCGALIKLGSLLGLYPDPGRLSDLLLHPDLVGRLWLLPRLASAVVVAAAGFVLFLTVRPAWGAGAGWLALVLTAASPIVLIETHALKPYAEVLLPVALTFYFLSRTDGPNARRHYWLAAVSAGAAVAALPTCVAFVALVCVAALFSRPLRLSLVFQCASISALVMLAFNPWLIWEASDLVSELTQFHTAFSEGISWLRFCSVLLPQGATYPVFAAAAGGAAACIFRRDRLATLALGALAIWLPHRVSIADMHYCEPVYPALALLAAYGVHRLRALSLAASRLCGAALFAAAALNACFFAMALHRFGSMQLEAGRWINSNIPAQAQILSREEMRPGLAGKSYPPFQVLRYTLLPLDQSRELPGAPPRYYIGLGQDDWPWVLGDRDHWRLVASFPIRTLFDGLVQRRFDQPIDNLLLPVLIYQEKA